MLLCSNRVNRCHFLRLDAALSYIIMTIFTILETIFCKTAFLHNPSSFYKRDGHQLFVPTHQQFCSLPTTDVILKQPYNNRRICNILQSNSRYHYSHGIHPLSKLHQNSYDSLLNVIPPSVQIVLIGEGTHGTEEFFRIRSEVTKCLIQHHGFDAILCEGDVQPFFELNKFVTKNQATTEEDIFSENDDVDQNHIRSMLENLFFDRFPDWMWSNVLMVEFVCWLTSFNSDIHAAATKLLLGFDIQSPFASMEFIIRKLSMMGENDLATLAKDCYAPLNKFRPNIRKYGDAVYSSKIPSQENAVKKVLGALLEKYKSLHAVQSCEVHDSDFWELQTWFELLENAHAIVASEEYHRQQIIPGHVATWNSRTNAFMNSILRTMDYIDQVKRSTATKDDNETPPVRLIVWAHNSHVGDMRSTGHAPLGQISLGQCCRETFGDHSVFLIGMTTYDGTVRAAYADRQGACWKGDGVVMTLKKALDDSHEYALHSLATSMKYDCVEQAFGMHFQARNHIEAGNNVGDGQSLSFGCDRRERFVGSCYLPQTEVMSHYTNCNLASQYDYVFHVDTSSAIAV